jgi:protein-disulfide isomerase
MTTLPKRVVQDIRIWLASPIAITITVLFLGGGGLTAALLPRDASAGGGTAQAGGATPQAPAPSSDQRTEFERWFTSQARVPLVIPKDGATVLILKFNDYQCPPCRQSYLQYKPILAKYEAEQPGAVRVVYKDFPLSAECNQQVPSPGPHASACEAAAAVRLAGFRTREPLVEWLFANQPTLTPQLVRQAAREVGGVSDFDARYASTLELVKGDIDMGRQLGVRSTPTFFIDGVKIEGALPPQFFDQAIAYELQHATAAGR